MLDRLKAIVASFLAFGALAIPGFSAFVTALGGDAGVMQAVVGGYAVYHVLRLAVDYLHGKAAGSMYSFLAMALLIPAVASAQDVTQRGDAGPALPEGAIAEREFRLVVGVEDVVVFTPKPQILSVGERCSRLKQACEFEAEIAERGALEYRWHAETEHARIFGATELPRFLVQFRRSSPAEGYKVKLLARRLDSPGDQWHEAESIVHIAGRPWWVNAAMVSGATALGVWLSTTHPDDLSTTSRDRLIGASLGAGVGLLATKISW